jgi:GNAT superfamily N-acetyltransferase
MTTEQVQVDSIDLESVWRIRRDVLFPGHPIERIKLDDDPAGTHLGVYVGDRPVSVISFFEKDGVCRFRKFATLHAHQGKGYGSLLLERVMALAEARRATSIWCSARKTACGLYERFGMRPVGNPWEENGHTYVKMEKRFSL